MLGCWLAAANWWFLSLQPVKVHHRCFAANDSSGYCLVITLSADICLNVCTAKSQLLLGCVFFKPSFSFVIFKTILLSKIEWGPLGLLFYLCVVSAAVWALDECWTRSWGLTTMVRLCCIPWFLRSPSSVPPHHSHTSPTSLHGNSMIIVAEPTQPAGIVIPKTKLSKWYDSNCLDHFLCLQEPCKGSTLPFPFKFSSDSLGDLCFCGLQYRNHG